MICIIGPSTRPTQEISSQELIFYTRLIIFISSYREMTDRERKFLSLIIPAGDTGHIFQPHENDLSCPVLPTQWFIINHRVSRSRWKPSRWWYLYEVDRTSEQEEEDGDGNNWKIQERSFPFHIFNSWAHRNHQSQQRSWQPTHEIKHKSRHSIFMQIPPTQSEGNFRALSDFILRRDR